MDIKIEGIDGFGAYDCSRFEQEKHTFFIDRRKHTKSLLSILAGYKSYLYDDVFARVAAFAPGDMDVCIISSGLYDSKLDQIAAKNRWSYLGTERNCLTLAQNMAISFHPKAEYLFKMDEDIFVTKHCFQTVLDTYHKLLQNGPYDIGFVAPLIPLNGYGHVRVLKKLGMVGLYEKMFGRAKYGGEYAIDKSLDAAKFFWGEGGFIPSIDYMDEEFHRQDFSYSACPVRFSIGFIFMHRNEYRRMGGWTVPKEGVGMGLDEFQLAQFCLLHSLGMIISENTVVGHFSFGPQNKGMKEYHATQRSHFQFKAGEQ